MLSYCRSEKLTDLFISVVTRSTLQQSCPMVRQPPVQRRPFLQRTAGYDADGTYGTAEMISSKSIEVREVEMTSMVRALAVCQVESRWRRGVVVEERSLDPVLCGCLPG